MLRNVLDDIAVDPVNQGFVKFVIGYLIALFAHREPNFLGAFGNRLRRLRKFVDDVPDLLARLVVRFLVGRDNEWGIGSKQDRSLVPVVRASQELDQLAGVRWTNDVERRVSAARGK